MPSPCFHERLNALVRRGLEADAKSRNQFRIEQGEIKAQEYQIDEEWKLAERDTRAKLVDLEVLPAFAKVEQAALSLYGPPPESSRLSRLYRRFHPKGFDRTTYGYGDNGIRVLNREVSAGSVYVPKSSYHDRYAPTFILTAVSVYPRDGAAGLAIIPGRLVDSTSSEAKMKDPRNLDSDQVNVPFVPLMDWTKERVEETVWDIMSKKPELKILMDKPS